MSNKAKSLDDLFEDKPLAVNPGQGGVKQANSLDDLFQMDKDVIPSHSPTLSKESANAVGGLFMAPALGAIEGIGAGYPRRFFSKDMKAVEDQNPVLTTLGRIGGGVAPGMGLSKILGLAKGLPYVGVIGEGGFVQGAASGAIEGGAMDPGDNGSRTQNAAIGAGLGGPLGFLTKGAKDVGETVGLYNKLNSPNENISRTVKDKFDEAISQMMAKEVTPRQSELQGILKDKRISLNPELLEGFERPSLTGADRQKGGLGTLSDIARENGNLSAKTGQKIKQYLDDAANYARQKPFSDMASAKGDKAKYAADILRGKLSELNPRISELNEPMGRALNLRNSLKPSAEANPMATISADPLSDKGQLVQELDRLAGSDLQGLGKKLKEARGLPTRATDLLKPMSVIPTTLKYGKKATGNVSNLIDKISPPGTKESILQTLLMNLRNDGEAQ